MKRINITHAATVFGVAGLLGVASLAIAADQKPAASKAAPAMTDPAKLAKFANVVVVKATPEQLAAIAHERRTGELGMKIAVDPVTKRIRQYTPDDAAEQAAAEPPAPAEAAATEFTTSSGVKGVVLNSSSMAYAVAHVGNDGKVRQACLENQANDEAAMKASAAATEVNKNEK
jgi:hypothetical protein